jgi:hypothetical protein
MKKTTRKKTAAEYDARYGSVLNFRVPQSFKREFRIYAAAHDLTLSQLLRELFEARVAKDAA